MRISDWSSDVCSSDLATWSTSCWLPSPGRKAARSSKLTIRAAITVALPNGGWLRSASKLGRPDTGFSRWAEARRRLRETLALIAAIRHSAVPIDEVTSLPARTTLAVINNSRSEEHTSELQSLLRISYAVFCLKKKKSTIQNNN